MSWKSTWRRRQLLARFRRKLFPPRRSTLAAHLSVLAFASVLGFILFSSLLFAFYARDLPRPDKIVRREGFATKIYDREGELLYDVYAEQRRTPVELSQIPLYLQQATVAIEDKNFYRHGGFDPTGIFRALYNIIVHRRLQGGSTLTQQLVKNVLLTPQRTIPRKIKEFILAVQIENRYSKDEILQMYLNEAPFGGTAWGVQAAAETYFDKDVSQLSLTEAVILAGLPQRPSAYSPFGEDPEAYISRAEAVLRRMREDGYITPETEAAVKEELPNVEFAPEGAKFAAPHFVMYVRKVLAERYGERLVEQGGLRVYTTLDSQVQQAAEVAVAEEIAKVESLNITNGAALVMDPENGEILAMVGSKDYEHSEYGKFNVTTALRQPGSAIKPATYVTALKKGYTASTLIMDTPTIFPVTGQPDYAPENYDGQFHGPLQARYALGNSINLAAVKMLAQVGLRDMLATAYDLGFTTLEPTAANMRRFGLSVTLGGGEVRLIDMVTAYSAFANGGLRVEPVAILRVEDAEGKVLEEHKPVTGRRVLTPQQAFIINHILSDNSARLITFGERSAINIPGRTIAVKTGTTNDKRDNWTVGWTSGVVAGVWVGNNDNSEMKQVASGVTGAAPIWRRIIMAALSVRPKEGFAVPEGIVTAEVDAVSGYRAHDNFPSRVEYFIAGTEPTGPDPVHTKLKLCRGQDTLANEFLVARGDFEEKEYFVFTESDPVSTDGINRWQEGINGWLETQSDPRYHPPTEYCGSEEIAVELRSPANETRYNTNDILFEARPISAGEIVRVEFLVDGSVRETLTGEPYRSIIFVSDGPHRVGVRVRDSLGNEATREANIGVNWDWDKPLPTPTPTPTPTPSPSPTPTATP